jgi:hypothetical protein
MSVERTSEKLQRGARPRQALAARSSPASALSRDPARLYGGHRKYTSAIRCAIPIGSLSLRLVSTMTASRWSG